MPGCCSCMYYGSVDLCDEEIVPVETLPAQCSSFIQDGIYINEAHEIKDSYSELGKGMKPFFFKFYETYLYLLFG